MFCDNHLIVTYWLKKREKIFTFLKYPFLEKGLLLSISINFLQTPFLDGILLRNFTMSNSDILVEDLIRQKRCFEIFLIDHLAGDTGNKNVVGNY